MTLDEQIERALDEVLEVMERWEGTSPAFVRDELRDVLSSIIARAGAEAREAEDERRGVENFDGPGRW